MSRAGCTQVPAKYVVGLLSGKLVLHPLLGLACCLAALHLHLLPPGIDPLMVLVMLLVWSSPTAVLVHSLATMLQVGWVVLTGNATMCVCHTHVLYTTHCTYSNQPVPSRPEASEVFLMFLTSSCLKVRAVITLPWAHEA